MGGKEEERTVGRCFGWERMGVRGRAGFPFSFM